LLGWQDRPLFAVSSWNALWYDCMLIKQLWHSSSCRSLCLPHFTAETQ
jgi:hypothetical protein